MEIKEFILNLKEKLNIDIIRVTDGKASDFLEPRLLERIEEGKITEFEDRNLEEKIDINKVLPGYKSVIVIGQSYLTSYKEKVDFNKGILSKSSWGRDYHYVLRDKMDIIVEELNKNYGGYYKAYVDTGPLVDRNLAYISGVGHYGKNCSIINKDYGSFIFIGYIITDLYIERDGVDKGECGDCRRCLDYCPTKAIEADYKLNPKRCISYLTQTKEKIPYDLREKMGAKIYGCDTCQDVCPKNEYVYIPSHKEFIPIKTKGYMDIDEILTMSNREFKDKYGDMSGAWRGKNILKRNAIIAIANKKDKDYLGVLLELLDDDSQMIAQYAMWSILRIDSFEGKKLIEERLASWDYSRELLTEYSYLKKYFSI